MQLNAVYNGEALETLCTKRSWSLPETWFERGAMASTDGDKVRRIKRVVELWRSFEKGANINEMKGSDAMMVAVETIVSEESAEQLVLDRESGVRRKGSG